jgi:hypothetical protein
VPSPRKNGNEKYCPADDPSDGNGPPRQTLNIPGRARDQRTFVDALGIARNVDEPNTQAGAEWSGSP